MTPLLYGLGQRCVRHRLTVFAVWLVVVAALAIAARTVGPDVNDNLTLPGSDSQQATDLLEQRFPSQANGTNPVVLKAPSGDKLTDERFSKPIDDTVAALRADADVRDATSPLSSAGADFLSKGKSTGYIALNLSAGPSDLTTDDAERIVAEADPARKAGLSVGFGGYLGQKVSKPETHSSEAVGLGMAVIVLLFTFGTVVAMGLPIVTAIFGLVSGLSIITLISQVAEVPTVAPTLATMIGLGVGIDYALFIVTRHQAQRRAGMATDESIARACATSGGAVVFAGTTVIVALLSLAIVDIPLVTTLGYTSALVVAVAVAAAVTLLPAVLAIVGDRIDALALPHRRAATDDHPHGWERWGRAVARRPLPSAIVAVVVLVALAVPALDLYLGQQDNGALPTSTDARRAYDGMTAAFGPGANGPLLVASTCRRSRPRRTVADRRHRQAGGRAEAAGAEQGRRPGAADRGVPRGPGRPAGAGAVAGRGAGQAAARRADQADPGAGGGSAQEGAEQGDRSAPADAAHGPAEDQRRRQGDPAARQLVGQRGRADRDAEDGPVRPRHRAARAPHARRHDPHGDRGRRHDRGCGRDDRRLRRSGRRDLRPAGARRSASSSR